MFKVFIDDISSIKNDSEFWAIFNTLPEYRKNKINSLKFRDDKCLSLLVGKLFKEGLKTLGYENYDEKVALEESGKPYIPGNPIYFSMSHSGTKAMVVISDSEVGCDIQLKKSEDTSLADRFFTETECNEINSSDNHSLTFYKMWTLKESFMKLTGKGLSLGLKNVHVDGCKINDEKYSSYTFVAGDYVASYILTKKKANLIFDCDGTLLDSYESISDRIVEVFKKFNIKCDAIEARKLATSVGVPYAIETICKRNNIDPEKGFETYKEIEEKLDLITLFDGCIDILNNKNFNCFVYTHRGLSSIKLFEKLGIDKFLIENVNSSYKLKPKPDAEGVNYIVEKYGLNKEETYYVGDRVIDIECGNNAGVKTIFFNSNSLDIDTSKATFIVNNLKDILKLPF